MWCLFAGNWGTESETCWKQACCCLLLETVAGNRVGYQSWLNILLSDFSFFQDGLKAAENLTPFIEKLASSIHTVNRNCFFLSVFFYIRSVKQDLKLGKLGKSLPTSLTFGNQGTWTHWVRHNIKSLQIVYFYHKLKCRVTHWYNLLNLTELRLINSISQLL